MLTQREDKYTSASPRCTCLPPRQHCAGVALGSPLPTPQHCWFGRRTSTTRLRLVVLASSSSTMLWSCTRWTSDSNAMLILRKDKYTSAAPLCTCLPPHQHWTEVALGGKQVHLGFASVYLLSSSCNFSSSTPRPSSSTWTWTRCTWEESVVSTILTQQKTTTDAPLFIHGSHNIDDRHKN